MNKRIKTKWIKALRSGKYKQGTGRLKTNDGGFCCLGVLSDLYAKEKKIEWISERCTLRILDEGFVLSDEIMLWAGLKGNSDIVIGENVASVWNDDEEIGFQGIATLIEEHL